LNRRIGEYELKLKQSKNYLRDQKIEYESLLDKVSEFRNRFGKCAILLTEFIEYFVEKEPDLLNRQEDFYLDLD